MAIVMTIIIKTIAENIIVSIVLGNSFLFLSNFFLVIRASPPDNLSRERIQCQTLATHQIAYEALRRGLLLSPNLYHCPLPIFHPLIGFVYKFSLDMIKAYKVIEILFVAKYVLHLNETLLICHNLE